ncbi:hypothetical protein ACV1CY_07410 [Aeromonas caviae]
MKILIYGEYSGYGESLSKGFEELGYHAEVFSPNGDGFKEIESSLKLKSKKAIFKLFELWCLIPRLSRFDKIIIMNPSFFSIFKGFGLLPLLFFVAMKKDLYLLCCGDDVEYIRAGDKELIAKYVYESVSYPKRKYFGRKLDFFVNYLCAKYSKFIIPVMYDYEVGWKSSKFREKVTKVIPLACYFDPEYISKTTNYKEINILHGINRPQVKGSSVIIRALNRISDEFDNVKVHLPERISQKDYFKIFKDVDIAIDQCKCHGYGMNAIYSMMHGHIVLAPADDLYNRSLDLSDNPVVSIEFDEEVIYSKLKMLLNRRDLDEIKQRTKKFANDIHQSKKVSAMLLSYILK